MTAGKLEETFLGNYASAGRLQSEPEGINPNRCDERNMQILGISKLSLMYEIYSSRVKEIFSDAKNYLGL